MLILCMCVQGEFVDHGVYTMVYGMCMQEMPIENSVGYEIPKIHLLGMKYWGVVMSEEALTIVVQGYIYLVSAISYVVLLILFIFVCC